MGYRVRHIPSASVALAGIPIVLNSAKDHLDCAAVLAAHGQFGPARAHLILAIEEAEKARTLGQIVLKEPLTEAEIKSRLYSHSKRHIGALRKSWSQGPTIDYIADSLRERLRLKPTQTDAQRWESAIARHPEALPRDWPEKADELREGGLYVDLGDDDKWHSPADVPSSDYEELRPKAEYLFRYVSAAYEREVRTVSAN
jgi:AbiV family abortive infection protein